MHLSSSTASRSRLLLARRWALLSSSTLACSALIIAACSAEPAEVEPEIPVEAGTPLEDAGRDDARVEADADPPTPRFSTPESEMVGRFSTLFNEPAEAPGFISFTIPERLIQFIDGSSAGSEIRAHITSLSNAAITDALIGAAERGVAVQVVSNGNPTPELERLAAGLGNSFVSCAGTDPVNTACVSNLPGGTHHLKAFFFSKVETDIGPVEWITVVSSLNLTQTSARQFNDALIVAENKEVYDAFVTSYEDFFEQRKSGDYFNVPGRGHHYIASANYEITYSPQTSSPGHTEYHLSNDPVALALSRIDAFEPGCALKIANLNLSNSRSAIVDQLLRIKELGCTVEFAFTGIEANAFARLDGKIDMRRMNVERPGTNLNTSVHNKMMLYRGPYDGAKERAIVWTGSHNWTMGSLRQRDEVLVAVARRSVHDAYDKHFETIWKHATTTPLFP
jgi:phosphatidylserine/phosphatidylglycerophosphate/cardiolipin synthase-like enzyme